MLMSDSFLFLGIKALNGRRDEVRDSNVGRLTNDGSIGADSSAVLTALSNLSGEEENFDVMAGLEEVGEDFRTGEDLRTLSNVPDSWDEGDGDLEDEIHVLRAKLLMVPETERPSIL